MTSLMAGYILSDLLAKYRRTNPQVEVTAIEDNGEYPEHLLIGGELDVAVMVISNLHDKLALQVEILDVPPYRLWLPIGHKLLKQDSISVDNLTSGQLIMLDIDEMGEAGMTLLSALGTRPKIAFRTRSVEGRAQSGGDRRRNRLAAGSGLPAVVVGGRPDRGA